MFIIHRNIYEYNEITWAIQNRERKEEDNNN